MTVSGKLERNFDDSIYISINLIEQRLVRFFYELMACTRDKRFPAQRICDCALRPGMYLRKNSALIASVESWLGEYVTHRPLKYEEF